MIARRASLLAIVLTLAVAACGSSGASGSVTVSDAWVRAAAAGGTTAAYLTVRNASSADDRIVGVSAPATVAGSASLHETTTGASGMTGMQMTPEIKVPAGQTVKLEPGGYHIMLMELAGELTAGATVELTLTFEHAGPMKVQAQVKAG